MIRHLNSVIYNNLFEGGKEIEVGKRGVKSITVDATGNGPMGKFDVVRIEYASYDDVFEFPLHFCHGWNEEETQ